MKEDAKKKGTKRKIAEEDYAHERTETQTTEIRRNVKRSCKIVKVVTEESTSEDGDDGDSSEKAVEEDICIICGDRGKHREMWLQCCTCGEWAHEACTDNELCVRFLHLKHK